MDDEPVAKVDLSLAIETINNVAQYQKEVLKDTLIREFQKLSTVENDTIWYIDEDADVRMPLDDWITQIRAEAGK